MARALQTSRGLAHLDLDAIAWAEPAVRLPLSESVAAIEAFQAAHGSWVIEGSYGSLVAAALPRCTELRFLNPGVDTCIKHCRSRPWEPDKYASKQEQDTRLAFLIEWVKQYDAREDEYGLAQHRAIFDSFAGPKREYDASQLRSDAS